MNGWNRIEISDKKSRSDCLPYLEESTENGWVRGEANGLEIYQWNFIKLGDKAKNCLPAR